MCLYIRRASKQDEVLLKKIRFDKSILINTLMLNRAFEVFLAIFPRFGYVKEKRSLAGHHPSQRSAKDLQPLILDFSTGLLF